MSSTTTTRKRSRRTDVSEREENDRLRQENSALRKANENLLLEVEALKRDARSGDYGDPPRVAERKRHDLLPREFFANIWRVIKYYAPDLAFECISMQDSEEYTLIATYMRLFAFKFSPVRRVEDIREALREVWKEPRRPLDLRWDIAEKNGLRHVVTWKTKI